MPRSKDQELEAAFRSWKDETKKGWTVQCTHCGWRRARHAGRQRQHLEECRARRSRNEADKKVEKSHQSNIQHEDALARHFERQATRAILLRAHSLDIFEDPDMIELLHFSVNKHIIPPTANDIKTRLLEEVWREDFLETKAVLERQAYLNLSIDTDNNGLTSVHVLSDRGAFYLFSTRFPVVVNRSKPESSPDSPESIPVVDNNEEYEKILKKSAETLFNQILDVLAGLMAPRPDWDRFNAVLFNPTNPLSRHLTGLIEGDYRTKHVFALPCFSGVLLHMIEDILADPHCSFRLIIRKAMQYYHSDILKKRGEPNYDDWDLPFLLRVTTSVLPTLEQQHQQQPGHNIRHDPEFWRLLPEYHTFLTTIVKIQHQLETSPSGNLAQILHVFPELLSSTPKSLQPQVEKHLSQPASPLYTITSLLDPSGPASSSYPSTPKISPQTSPHLSHPESESRHQQPPPKLTPPTPTTPTSSNTPFSTNNNKNHNTNTPESAATLILTFLQHHCPPSARQQYGIFRLRQCGLSRTWLELSSMPLTFWREMAMFTDSLGKMAVRLFNIPPTSRPTERRRLEKGLGEGRLERAVEESGVERRGEERWKFCFVNRRVLRGEGERGWGNVLGKDVVEADVLRQGSVMVDEMTATIANAEDADMRGNEKPGMEVDIKPRHSERETGGGGGSGSTGFASTSTTKAALPPINTTNFTTINPKARLSSPEDNYDSENYNNSPGPQERAAASVLASVSVTAATNPYHSSLSSPVQHTPPSASFIAAVTTPAEKKTATAAKEGHGNSSGEIITPTRKRITRSHSGDILTERVRVKADPLGQRPAEWALKEEVEAVGGGSMVRAEN